MLQVESQAARIRGEEDATVRVFAKTLHEAAPLIGGYAAVE